MAKFTALLNQLIKKERPKQEVAKQEFANGDELLEEKVVEKPSQALQEVAHFSALISELQEKAGQPEESSLARLLESHRESESFDYSEDLRHLLAITSEVKAINNQAAILHGERIKRAQEILKNYKEGAFTSWLKSTYGNRQTPYNFLQYYLFYNAVPSDLRSRVATMPRQAVYALASRQGELEKKLEIVENYQGETKLELLGAIRATFPLAEKDRRRENVAETTFKELGRLIETYEKSPVKMDVKQRGALLNQLKLLESLVKSVELV